MQLLCQTGSETVLEPKHKTYRYQDLLLKNNKKKLMKCILKHHFQGNSFINTLNKPDFKWYE